MTAKKIFLTTIIVLIVVVSFVLVYSAGRKVGPFQGKYQVVTLDTGEVYFGKLSLFPSPKMTNVWIPQQSGTTKKPKLQIVPLQSLYFSPDKTLRLNENKILWWSDLSEDSEVVKIITGKAQSQGQTQTTTTPTK
jgi:hypothetical protein